jgi:Na+/H+-translocating membrane pyrophosphatase
MPDPQSEKESQTESSMALFWGCLMIALYSAIPLLTILSGILLISRDLVFWGIAIILFGLLALAGPFFAGAMSKVIKEKSSDNANEE